MKQSIKTILLALLPLLASTVATGQEEKVRRPYTSTEFGIEDMSDVEIEAYTKIAAIRQDSIKKMKNLVETTPNYPNMADICYRIAEFTFENIRFRLTLQQRQYRQDLERFKRGELEKEPTPPVRDYSETLPYYERILIEFPKYPRIEEVLFYLGRNGVETGRSLGDDKLVEKSIKYLEKLEELFPHSQFLPKAYLMAGEYFFSKNNLFDALKYYKKLTDNHKTAPMYLYALYKLGWTYYNYQQYDKTLACFEEVITKLREGGKSDDTLRVMTLKDYLVTVSEAGQGWTFARDFLFNEIGRDRTLSMMGDLAKLLAQHGFNDDAISIYHYFISLDENSPRVVDLWDRILNIYRFNYPFEEVEKQVRQLRFFFRSDGPWIANNQSTPEVLEKAADLLVKWDLSLAEYYLEEGLYFNKGEDALHLAIARSKDVLKKGAGKRAEQAWAGILLAHMGLIRLASRGKLIYVAENVLGPAYPDDYKLPRRVRRMKLEKFEQQFMDAKEQYLSLPNRSGQKPDLKPLAEVDMESNILYTSALIHYIRGMNEEGIKDIDLLIARDPKSTYLGWAGDMIFQMCSRTSDWSGLQRRIKAMLDAGNTAVTPERTLKEYLCSGMIQEARALADRKQPGDALEKLSSAAEICKENVNKAAEALYTLGEVAEKAGFLQQARDAYQKVLREYSRSKYRSMAQRGFARVKGK